MTEHLVDNCYGQDTFCERLVRIDRIGPSCRLIFASRDVTEPNYSIIVAKLVMPADFMVTLAYMAAGADPAVVSREFAIPAVVGTSDATRRIHTGDRVRVNGSTGQVFILSTAEKPGCTNRPESLSCTPDQDEE